MTSPPPRAAATPRRGWGEGAAPSWLLAHNSPAGSEGGRLQVGVRPGLQSRFPRASSPSRVGAFPALPRPGAGPGAGPAGRGLRGAGPGAGRPQLQRRLEKSCPGQSARCRGIRSRRGEQRAGRRHPRRTAPADSLPGAAPGHGTAGGGRGPALRPGRAAGGLSCGTQDALRGRGPPAGGAAVRGAEPGAGRAAGQR